MQPIDGPITIMVDSDPTQNRVTTPPETWCGRTAIFFRRCLSPSCTCLGATSGTVTLGTTIAMIKGVVAIWIGLPVAAVSTGVTIISVFGKEITVRWCSQLSEMIREGAQMHQTGHDMGNIARRVEVVAASVDTNVNRIQANIKKDEEEQKAELKTSEQALKRLEAVNSELGKSAAVASDLDREGKEITDDVNRVHKDVEKMLASSKEERNKLHSLNGDIEVLTRALDNRSIRLEEGASALAKHRNDLEIVHEQHMHQEQTLLSVQALIAQANAVKNDD